MKSHLLVIYSSFSLSPVVVENPKVIHTYKTNFKVFTKGMQHPPPRPKGMVHKLLLGFIFSFSVSHKYRLESKPDNMTHII